MKPLQNQIGRLGKHTTLYFIGTVLSKLVGFLMIPLYTRFLEPSEYGVIELLDLTGYVVAFLASMGIANAVMRYYFHYDVERERREVISTAALFLLPCSAVMLSIMFAAAPALARAILGSALHADYFKLLALILFFESALNFALSYVRALEKVALFLLVTSLKLILAVSLNVYFIAGLEWGVAGFLYSSLISSGLFGTIMLIAVMAQTGLRFNWKKCRAMLSFGAPLVPANLFELSLHYADRYFLLAYGNLSAVGLYALGYKFGMLLSVFLVDPFTMMWGVSMYALEKNPEAKQIHAKVLTYLVMALSAGALAISLLIADVLPLITTPAFYSASAVVPCIALAYIFFGMYQVVKSGLFLKDKTWLSSLILFIAALVNVVANLILIPLYQAMGAAVATLVTFLVLFAMTAVLAVKVYGVRYEYLRLLKIAALGFALFVVGEQVDWGLLPNLGIKLLLLAAFPVGLYTFNVFDQAEKALISGVAHRVPGMLKIGAKKLDAASPSRRSFME